jgi:hypothetical protein
MARKANPITKSNVGLPCPPRAASPTGPYIIILFCNPSRNYVHVEADVQEAIVPASGHWIMEANPSATVKLVTDFLKRRDDRQLHETA